MDSIDRSCELLIVSRSAIYPAVESRVDYKGSRWLVLYRLAS